MCFVFPKGCEEFYSRLLFAVGSTPRGAGGFSHGRMNRRFDFSTNVVTAFGLRIDVGAVLVHFFLLSS